jgi:hypothetical protein
MMKSIKATVILLVLLLGSLTATVACADGHFHGGYHGGYHGGGFGRGIGFGLGVGLAVEGWPYYYPYGYYPYGYYPYAAYPPVVVTQPAAPTVYIEQGNGAAQDNGPAAAAPAQSSNDWYYCRKPAGYYPYVRNCPDGWQRVPSQPQTQN